MKEDRFVQHCTVQAKNIWDVLSVYEGRSINLQMMKQISHDLKLVSKNIDELCDAYEMENKVK